MSDTLNAALAAVQSELPSVRKDQKATVWSQKGSYTYNYADLADVSAAVLPLLSEHGLSWTTFPTLSEGRFVLRYELRHTSGEFESGVYPLPEPGRPQEMGSAITYARRYALCAVTGVAPEEDDDNAAAAEQSASQRESKQAAQKKLKHQIWEQAEKRGWIAEDKSYADLSADFTEWSRGEQLESADEETLEQYLKYLQPKKTMQRGKQ